MEKFKLSNLWKRETIREGLFTQTQFANTDAQWSLCFVASPKYLEQAVKNKNISCIITDDKFANRIPEEKGLAVSNAPESAFYELHNTLYEENKMTPKMTFAVHDTANIHPSAVVSERSYIGKNVTIGPGAIIEDYTHIEDDVLIGSRAVIGANGYFYKRYKGRLFNVKHAGGVWLDQGVQILSGAVVSKALHTDFTYIGKQTVLSINAHVGHGCWIGEGCSIAGNAQISGFTKIGNNVWIGPSATITNLITIEDYASVEIGSVVIRDVLKGSRVSGNFAQDHKLQLRSFAKRRRDGRKNA